MPLFAVYLPVLIGALRFSNPLFHLAALGAAVGIGTMTGFTSFDFLRFALNGFVFAYALALTLKHNLPLFWVVFCALLPELAFLALCKIVPAYGKEFRDLIALASAKVNEALGITGEVETLPLGYLVPAAECCKHVAATLLLCFAFGRTADRPRPKLSDLQVPSQFIWVFSAGLLSALVGWPGHAGYYLLFIAILFYLLNGMSVVRLFFDKAQSGRWTEFFFYFIQPGLFFVPVFSIGILDTWWQFRERINGWNSTPGGSPQ